MISTMLTNNFIKLGKLFLLTALIFATQAYAFNYEECIRSYEPYKKPAKTFFSTSDATSNITVPLTHITQGPLMTSQSVSSTGSCRGIDFRNQYKLNYFAKNFENIKIDSSKGNGEYLSGLNLVLECGSENQSLFFEIFKSNFRRIFIHSNGSENTPSEAYDQIDFSFKATKLGKDCKLWF